MASAYITHMVVAWSLKEYYKLSMSMLKLYNRITFFFVAGTDHAYTAVLQHVQYFHGNTLGNGEHSKRLHSCINMITLSQCKLVPTSATKVGLIWSLPVPF